MKKLLSLGSFLAMLAFIAMTGCSSNDDPLKPTPIESGNYFPRYEGSYWIYNRYTTDSTNNPITDTKRIDSVSALPSVTQLGIECTPFHTYTSAPSEFEDYFYGDTNKLFARSDYVFLKKGVVPFDMPEIPLRWLNIADFSTESQRLLIDTTFSAITIAYTQYSINLTDIHYMVKVQKANDKYNIAVNGNILPAYGFVFTHTIEGKLEVKISGITYSTGTFSVIPIIRNYYSPNIGLVKSTMDPIVFTSNTTPDISPLVSSMIPKQGYTYNLMNYFVNAPKK
jgi:hypothetical protein